MPKYYTGVGARSTPQPLLGTCRQIGRLLAKRGYTLRSGAAEGADEAFEQGCIEEGGDKEIFIPWVGFRGKPTNRDGYYFTREFNYDGYKLAKNLAKTLHPNWDQLKDAHKMLHTRNVHQVLGLDAKTPSSFVICYTDKGEEVGGTAQAIRVAKYMRIPIYNLGSDTQAADLLTFLKTTTT